MRNPAWKYVSLAALFATGTAVALNGCGAASTALAVLFPAGLAFSSPLESDGKKSSLMESSDELAGVVAADDMDAKAAALQKCAECTASTDCVFTANFTANDQRANCYGPRISYSNHPETSPSGIPSTNPLPGGDVGIWTEKEGTTSEACAAAHLNKKVEGIAGQVDSALFVAAASVCAAKLNSKSISSEGDSADVTTDLQSILTANSISFTVSSAKIERATNSSDGYKVYISSVAGTVTESSKTKTVTLRLKHLPMDDSNSTYKGKLSYTVSVPTEKPGNCGSGSASGYLDAASIAYQKASATQLYYAVNSGQYCGSDADPYESSTVYNVDPTKTKETVTSGKGWANNFNVAKFDWNPSDGTGNFQFAWQAGSFDQKSRVMNVKLSSGTTVTGDAYFGFGPTVVAGAGAIDRMICNWVAPGGSIATGTYTGKSLAQRQSLSYDSTAKVFTPSASYISYAPTTSCDHPGGSFSYDNADSSTDTAVTAAFSNNLVALSTVSVTTPTAPADVDK